MFANRSEQSQPPETTTPLRKVTEQDVAGVVDRLKVSPQNLGGVLHEFIESGGNGIRIDWSQLAALVESGQDFAAVALLANGIDLGPATKSQSGSIEKARRKLSAVLPTTPHDLVVEQPSPVFRLGTAAHRLLEEIALSDGHLDELGRNYSIQTFEENNQITKIKIDKSKKIVSRQASFFDQVLPAKEQSPWIILEEPLPKKRENQPDSEWALNIIIQSIAEIIEQGGNLPHRPYDVARMLENDYLSKPLLRILEAAHVLYGDRPGLSLISRNTDQETASIGLETTGEFAILNWLSVVRAGLESVWENSQEKIPSGKLSELPIGTINFQVASATGEPADLAIKAGTIDLVEFEEIPVAGSAGKLAVDDINLSQLANHIEGQFNSQASRHRRKKNPDDGSTEESSTRLYRNMRSSLKELWRFRGAMMFDTLTIKISDFKCPGGDGGWWTMFNPEELPDNKHVQQLLEYIFFTISQLAWVEKWSQGEGENISLSLDEITDYCNRHSALSRVTGEIRYQLPDREISKLVALPTIRDFRDFGEKLLERKQLSEEQETQLKIFKALQKIAQHRIDQTQVIRKELRRLPEALQDFCLADNFGHFALPVENLANLDKQTRAAFTAKEGVYILWTTEIVPGHELRLAIDSKGNFTISGLEEGIVRGKLLSSQKMIGVNESAKSLMRIFHQEFWGRLENTRKFEAAVTPDYVLDSDGLGKRVVDGKFPICNLNLMTGVWSLDAKQLQLALDNLGSRDVFGFAQLASRIESGKEGAVFCPLPFHDNRNTEAAHCYGDHIFCFGCQQSISLPSSREKMFLERRLPLATGDRLEDYRPVSDRRQQAFGGILGVSQILAETDNTALRYIMGRGLGPDDLGTFGYIPPPLANNLADLIDLKLEHFSPDLRLDQLTQYAVAQGELPPEKIVTLERVVDGILEQLSPVKSSSLGYILNFLTLGQIQQMKRYGILGRTEKAPERLGGRLILPTFWFEKKHGNYRMAQSNFMARGITLDGHRLFQGQPHHKAFLGKASQKPGDDKILRSTPVGFWFPDRERFLLEVDDTIIVFEGALNQASFSRIRPDLKNICVTTTGTGFRQLVALLYWLGTANLPRTEKTFGKSIRTVVLARDFDKGGAVAAARDTEELNVHFPHLEIRTIHELLPEDLRHQVPSYDLEQYLPGGQRDGIKFDINDLLLLPGIRERYAYKS